MAPVLGADGRKIRADPRCQQAPALEPTGCTSAGVWGTLPLCRAHSPPLPAFEGAQHKHRSPLAISEAGSGLPPSEPFFPWPELGFTLCLSPALPKQIQAVVGTPGCRAAPEPGCCSLGTWPWGGKARAMLPAWTGPHVTGNADI